MRSIKIEYDLHTSVETWKGVVCKLLCSDKYIPRKAKEKIKLLCHAHPKAMVFIEGLYVAPLIRYIHSECKVLMSAVDSLSLASFRQFQVPGRELSYYVRHAVLFVQRYLFEKAYYSKCSIVVFVSEDDAEFNSRLSRVNCKIVPNGVDIEYFRCIHKYTQFNPKKFVFTGVLDSSMNEEAAIYSINILSSRGVDFVIAGRNPSEKLTAKAASTKDVFILRDLKDIREAFSEWCFFICPIEYGTGIKNNVLQALSMGFPCLVSTLIAKPIGLIDGENAIVYKNRQELDFILDNLDNYDEELISKNAEEHIKKNFSWPAVVDKYISIIQDL